MSCWLLFAVLIGPSSTPSFLSKISLLALSQSTTQERLKRGGAGEGVATIVGGEGKVGGSVFHNSQEDELSCSESQVETGI